MLPSDPARKNVIRLLRASWEGPDVTDGWGGCEIVGGLGLWVEHRIVGVARDTRMTMVEVPEADAHCRFDPPKRPPLLSLGRLPLWRPCLAAMLRIGPGRPFRGPATVMAVTTTVTHYRAEAIRCTIP
jgi:hypothetical protein